jgi:hypothetical protein
MAARLRGRGTTARTYLDVSEVDAFVGNVLNGGPPLATFGPPVVEGTQLVAPFVSGQDVKEALLCYTTDEGTWQKRQWHILPARIEGGRNERRNCRRDGRSWLS